jgi:hypothetical protein
MSSQLESIYSDELILLAETLGEVKTRTEKLEGEFSTHAKPLEAATNALSAALSGIKALQFHVLDNNLGALSARVEEMRKAVDEQVGVIALELKKADETNAAKAGAEAEALRSEIVALQSQLGSLVTQFGQQLERVEFAAKEEARKLQLIPGPAGAAGASLNPRGTFIDGETYNRLDVVSWLGSSYIATVDGVTEKPSKNSNQWQTLASRGGGGAGGVGDFGSLAGVAQINQGGTGQTTRVAALNALLPDQAGSTQYMLLTDGSGTVSWGAQPVAGLPSQTGNSGRLLTTNGSTASWSNAVTVSGSNATVGGTLTVSGTSSLLTVANSTGSAMLAVFASAYATGSATPYLVIGSFSDPATSGARIAVSTDYSLDNRAAIQLQTRTTAGTLQTALTLANTRNATFAADVAISGTTASTSTSSGALVVGNGTSGGLGVGGAINAGGAISTFTGGVTRTSLNTDGTMFWGVSANLGVLTWDTNKARVGAQSTADFALTTGTATDRLQISGSTGVITIPGTTASTSASSGALVVSGGVGVAGAIFAGAAVSSIQSSNSILAGASLENSSTGNAAAVRLSMTAGTRTGEINTYGSGHATLAGRIRVATSNGQIDFIPSGVFAMSIDANDVAIQSGIGLKLGNAYVAGAPTATGYIVIKDSTGTSYKIPAVAL